MSLPGSTPLLALLHLCDSLFPLGSFGHSDGLEAATASGLVATAADLQDWLTATRDELLARVEGPGLRIAFDAVRHGDFDAIRSVDDELHAMRPAGATRQASRAMGTRLLKTWQEIRPHPAISTGQRGPGSGFALPVAFGLVCAGAGVPLGSALEGYFYSRLAATVSASMRLIGIGQHQAHALLADALAGIPAAASVAAAGGRPAGFAPALDLASMSHRYVHSRLFRS